MAISLAIMDTGFKRYNQLKEGVHKINTREVLQLSIIDQFQNCRKCAFDIINSLFSGKKLDAKLLEINKWYAKINFIPKRIDCQKVIVQKLYKNNKYYLD